MTAAVVSQSLKCAVRALDRFPPHFIIIIGLRAKVCYLCYEYVPGTHDQETVAMFMVVVSGLYNSSVITKDDFKEFLLFFVYV